MSDEERIAIAVLKGGDINGLESLVRCHQLRAVRVAYGVTGNRDMAEDVVADAFLAAYEHIGQYDESRPFVPWFYRIVIKTALKTVSRRRALSGDRALDALAGQADPAPSPDVAYIQTEAHQAVLAAIDSLPPKQRAVLVLRYYLDMDERAIAEVLGCPLGTVKWRLHAGHRRLRRRLVRTDALDLGPLWKGEG